MLRKKPTKIPPAAVSSWTETYNVRVRWIGWAPASGERTSRDWQNATLPNTPGGPPVCRSRLSESTTSPVEVTASRKSPRSGLTVVPPSSRPALAT